MTPTVSVALCTFNGERYLGEQLASILTQSRLPDELIISDDGSTDSSVALAEGIIADFHAEHPEVGLAVRVLRNPAPLGVTRNFEQAIRATTGDFVVLSDQDDRWIPDRIALAVDRFDADPDLLLLHSDARLVDGESRPLGDTLFGALAMTGRERAQIHGGDALGALLGRNLVTGATTMFRRSLLDAALPFPASWVHDEWLAAIAAATGRVDFTSDALIDYRQHGGNAIGADRIGLAGRIGKLREPRTARNRALVERAADLLDRVANPGLSVDAAKVGQTRAKLAHERLRESLPAPRIRRIGGVLRELRRGGYSRYGRGLQDALRDIVQPSG